MTLTSHPGPAMPTRIAATLALALLLAPRLSAYVEAPLPLGAVVQQSVVVCSMVVTKVDKANNLIVFQKTADLKGKHPQEVIKHNIGRGGLRPGEWEEIMRWAEVGRPAVFFHNGSASETYIGPTWYQAYPNGEWWGMSHGEPFLLRSYCGKVEKLPALVADIVAGREVVVPCMLDGDKEALHKKTAKVQRMKVSLKLQDYNAKRDFAGWGGEDVRVLQGMPGFARYAGLGNLGRDALGLTTLDVDGDGRADLCLVGAYRISVLLNGGDSFTEATLPGLVSGARAACWADIDGDGRPDLIVAGVAGPRLYMNLGKGTFRDDTAKLPPGFPAYVTAATLADFDGDGRPDLLAADGFAGLRLFRNTPAGFADESAKWGLDALPTAAGGTSLTVADFDGDGTPDVLFNGGGGLLLFNRGGRLVSAGECGLTGVTGKLAPAVADFDGDGHLDVLVPTPTGVKLFRNDGRGKFADVTAAAGDLAALAGPVTGAAWGDFDDDGRPGLLVTMLREPNRYFRNVGGKFADRSSELGLDRRTFGTQAAGFADLNGDGRLDLVLVNECLESAALMADLKQPAAPPAKFPVSFPVNRLRTLLAADGKPVPRAGRVAGGGRGSFTLTDRVLLAPGDYKLAGPPKETPFTVAGSPLFLKGY